MAAQQIRDALTQVKKLQEVILEKRRFRGFSGTARMAGGLVALVGAAVMASAAVPKTPMAQLAGWGCVLAVSLLLNYGALAAWFLFDSAPRRQLARLMPALDAVPCLAAGAVLSLAAVLHGQHQLLFGIWMIMYGLVHFLYRQSLPRTICVVGVVYMLSGAYCLLAPGISFVNPWPMGLVFFFGEFAGGFILYGHRHGECPT